MSEALAILSRHLRQAESDRQFHLARQQKGNLEAMIAGLKASWLQALIKELEEASR